MWKKSRNFQKLTLFSILYDGFINFSENRDKELMLGRMYFNFPSTGGTTSAAAYSLSKH